MRHFLKTGGLLATIAFTAICTGSAQADAPGALEQAMLNTLKQPSYHMTMVTPASGTIEGDVVNPGRTHVVMKNAEMIVIDQTTYMKLNGTWRKFPGLDLMKAQANPLQSLAASKGKYTVDDLGPKTVDGAVLHGYRTTNLAKKTTATLFVDGSGRIVRIESGAAVIKMSKFGEAVTIVAPM